VSHHRIEAYGNQLLLVCQLYVEGADYLESHVANAVCNDLIVRLVRQNDPEDVAARGLHEPYFEIRHDFTLEPRGMDRVRLTA
jgi:hypothetical protein